MLLIKFQWTFLLVCEQHESYKNLFQVCSETWVGDIISTVVTCLAEASCRVTDRTVCRHTLKCFSSAEELAEINNLTFQNVQPARCSTIWWRVLHEQKKSSKSKIPGNIYLTLCENNESVQTFQSDSTTGSH